MRMRRLWLRYLRAKSTVQFSLLPYRVALGLLEAVAVADRHTVEHQRGVGGVEAVLGTPAGDVSVHQQCPM